MDGRKEQAKKQLAESSGGPEMFRVLRSEKLNESLQEKNYIPFPMASTYEKGEGNEYLWDIQYAPGIRGAV